MSSALSKRNPYWPAQVQRCSRSFSLADDAGEIRYCALARLQHVDPLDGTPELLLLFEVHPVTLVPAFDQNAEEAEKKLQIFLDVRESENGLIVKSRDSRPTLRYVPPKMRVTDS